MVPATGTRGVNAKYPSPSRYSSVTGRTEPPPPPGGSGDRQRGGGRGARTQLNVDEQRVRFVTDVADDYDDNNDAN